MSTQPVRFAGKFLRKLTGVGVRLLAVEEIGL